MSHLYNVNEQVDDDCHDRVHSVLEECHQNLQLQSFVDRDGIKKSKRTSIDRTKQYVRRKCLSLTLEYCINAILNKITLIRCLKEYNIRENLFGDITSGITMAIMHMPQGKK